jgi:hypothetical protein
VFDVCVDFFVAVSFNDSVVDVQLAFDVVGGIVFTLGDKLFNTRSDLTAVLSVFIRSFK